MAAAAVAAGVLSRAAQLDTCAALAGLRRLALNTARSSRRMGAGRRFGTSWRATRHCAASRWIQTSLRAAVPSPTMQPWMRCWASAGAARGCSCAACLAVPAHKRFGTSCSSAKRFHRGRAPSDSGRRPCPTPCPAAAPCPLYAALMQSKYSVIIFTANYNDDMASAVCNQPAGISQAFHRKLLGRAHKGLWRRWRGLDTSLQAVCPALSCSHAGTQKPRRKQGPIAASQGTLQMGPTAASQGTLQMSNDKPARRRQHGRRRRRHGRRVSQAAQQAPARLHLPLQRDQSGLRGSESPRISREGPPPRGAGGCCAQVEPTLALSSSERAVEADLKHSSSTKLVTTKQDTADRANRRPRPLSVCTRSQTLRRTTSLPANMPVAAQVRLARVAAHVRWAST